MTAGQILLLCGGLALLTAGAEFLVRGASRLAAIAGISPLVIGLTVVAMGTGTPELAVNIESAISGHGDVGFGNIVGSNIFNVLFTLGLCAVILPLRVAQQLIWLDVPLMIGASCLVLVMALDGHMSRFDGAILFAGAVLYTIFAIKQGREESTPVELEYADEFRGSAGSRGWPFQIVWILVGLGMLVLGARWLVSGAVDLAKLLGLSELVIGLTIIAGGTSLPEVATSVVAIFRGKRDIAVGNIIGSNLFNIVAVLGLSSLAAPHGIDVAPAAITFDLPIMIAVAVACLPIFTTGHLIARWEGLVFLIYYASYLGYVILNAKSHDALPAFSLVMLEFVLPLTLLTVMVTYVRYAAGAPEHHR